MCHHCGYYSLCCTVLLNLQIAFILSSKKTTSAKALKKKKNQNKDGLQNKGTAYKYSVTKCWLLQLISSTEFYFCPPLQHSCCLYVLNPWQPPSSSNSRAGQVSNTPHHTKMKLVIQNTRPTVLP